MNANEENGNGGVKGLISALSGATLGNPMMYQMLDKGGNEGFWQNANQNMLVKDARNEATRRREELNRVGLATLYVWQNMDGIKDKKELIGLFGKAAQEFGADPAKLAKVAPTMIRSLDKQAEIKAKQEQENSQQAIGTMNDAFSRQPTEEATLPIPQGLRAIDALNARLGSKILPEPQGNYSTMSLIKDKTGVKPEKAAKPVSKIVRDKNGNWVTMKEGDVVPGYDKPKTGAGKWYQDEQGNWQYIKPGETGKGIMPQPDVVINQGSASQQTTETSDNPYITTKIAKTGTGPKAYVQQFLNNFVGPFTPGVPYEDTSTAKQKIQMFNQHAKTAFVNNPRFPVAEQLIVKNFLIDENKIFTDPDEQANKIENMVTFLNKKISQKQNILKRGSITKEQSKDYLSQINDMRSILDLIETGVSPSGKFSSMGTSDLKSVDINSLSEQELDEYLQAVGAN